MRFEFATASQIVFGAGTLREIGALAQPLGRRALVVTGSDSRRTGRLIALLGESGIAAVKFSVSAEPEITDVEIMARKARSEHCDLVIGYGGGSVLDTAKAVSAMLTNDGPLIEYLEIIGRGQALTKPAAPLIAIPTTAGTGSEVTRNAVLASLEHKIKVSLRSLLMLPRIALVGPELTYALPPALTASTGLDALTQLIEPYVCRRANPMTDGFCVEGIRRSARALRVAFGDGANPAAREDMAMASLLGGLALANAGLGAVHGFAGPIGGMFPAPHGAVCAALLPHVMTMNLRALRLRAPASEALRRYAEVARLLTGQPTAEADDGQAWIAALVRDLQIPPLGSYGLRREHVGEVVTKAINASSMKANPIALTEGELTEVLQAAL